MKLRVLPLIMEMHEGARPDERWILQKEIKCIFFWKNNTTTWEFVGNYSSLEAAKQAAKHAQKEIVYL